MYSSLSSEQTQIIRLIVLHALPLHLAVPKCSLHHILISTEAVWARITTGGEEVAAGTEAVVAVAVVVAGSGTGPTNKL